jgi:hypothetical protein
LGFEIINGASGNPEASLTSVTNGKREKLFAGNEEEEGGLVVKIENVSTSDDELSVAGTFATQMGTSENYGRDIDLTSPLQVTGSFNVVLGPVE